MTKSRYDPPSIDITIGTYILASKLCTGDVIPIPCFPSCSRSNAIQSENIVKITPVQSSISNECICETLSGTLVGDMLTGVSTNPSYSWTANQNNYRIIVKFIAQADGTCAYELRPTASICEIPVLRAAVTFFIIGFAVGVFCLAILIYCFRYD